MPHNPIGRIDTYHAPVGRTVADAIRLTAHRHGYGTVLVSAAGTDRTGILADLFAQVGRAAPWACVDELDGRRAGDFFHLLVVVRHPGLATDADVASPVAALATALNDPAGHRPVGRQVVVADTARLTADGPADVGFLCRAFAALADLDVNVWDVGWRTAAAGRQVTGRLTARVGVPVTHPDIPGIAAAVARRAGGTATAEPG